jgi:hypothetical protein
MSTPSQRGHIAWAVQSAKVGDGTFAAGDYDSKWQRHRAESVNLGVNDFYDVLPQEVGGTLFANSSYKNGAFVAGGARIYSRLQSSIGHLLYGAAGYATAATAATGVGRNTRFMVKKEDETLMPWMALRKYTPAAQAASGLTEYFIDCKVNMLTINVPAMGPTMMEFAVIGRKPINAQDESATGSSYESGAGLAHSCKGEIELDAFDGQAGDVLGTTGGKFTSAQIMIANNISQPDQQMVIGSYHPDDLVPLSRSVQIRMIYKWTDAKLYKKLYYNGGTDWSPIVGNSKVRIKTASVDKISTTETNPYSMEFVAPDVDWTMAPPQLAGNNLLFTEFTGIVKGGNLNSATWWIDLFNTTDYTSAGILSTP